MQGLAADLVRLSLGRETAAAGVTYTGAVMPEVVERIHEVASERPGHTRGSLNEIGWEIGVSKTGPRSVLARLRLVPLGRKVAIY